MILIGVFIAVLVLTGGAHFGVMSWAAAAVAAFAYYRFDIWRRPLIPCRVCKGSGANFSHLGGSGAVRRPFGFCLCCHGKKYHSRLGARFLAPSQYRAVKSGQHGKHF